MSTTVSYKGNTIATLNNETKTLTTAGTWVEGNITVTDTKDNPNLQAKTNITPIQSSQTITADSGYDGLSSVQINAMPSGTAGTPTATKGTVSNHSISVTPSVTNTTGYITGGTETGTAVTVSASELASGNKAITSNGTGIDVVGYSTVSVAVEGEVSMTDVANTTGTTAVITGETTTLTTKNITQNGTYTASTDGADGYSSVTVNVSGGGSISRTVIASEQTVTVSEYFTALTSTDGLVEGDAYVYTIDGVEIVGTAMPNSTMLYLNSGATYAIGDNNGTLYLVTNSTGQHTVKVEKLNLDASGGTPTPSGTWELVGIGTAYVDTDGSFNINDLTQPLFSGEGELWKVTYDNTSYECETIALNTTTYYLGNVNIPSGTDDGTGLPFFICDYAWGVEGTFRDKPQTATSKSIRLDKYVSGGSTPSIQTETGTFTGSDGNTIQISCDFEPREIYIRGDLTGDVSLRGIISFTLIKDRQLIITNDTSTSNTAENAWMIKPITGYNQANSSSEPYASYSNGTLTINTVVKSSGARFPSGVTYDYTLIGWSGGTPSATTHEIYFEFSDSTDTTITAYYDDSFISSAITATTPTTYGQKTVTLAQLDGVTWYPPQGTWQTIFDGSVYVYPDGGFNINDVTLPLFGADERWRVTYFDGSVYECTTASTGSEYYIGNLDLTDTTGLPFNVVGYTWGTVGHARVAISDPTFFTFKLEKYVTT